MMLPTRLWGSISVLKTIVMSVETGTSTDMFAGFVLTTIGIKT
jgi:hypothetical protein